MIYYITNTTRKQCLLFLINGPLNKLRSVHVLQISMASFMAILDVVHFLSISFSIYLWYKSKIGKGWLSHTHITHWCDFVATINDVSFVLSRKENENDFQEAAAEFSSCVSAVCNGRQCLPGFTSPFECKVSNSIHEETTWLLPQCK